MRLYVKNMVCDRCIMAVRTVLERLDLRPLGVQLGIVDLEEDELPEDKYAAVNTRLGEIGFELLEDRRHKVTEAIRTAVIDLIHRQNDDTRIMPSEYLAQALELDYSYLSKVFSDEEGITIERYVILQKIEKVKELLAYGELTLSEIAWRMGYSSVAALSAQFKKVMNITPSGYKKGVRERKTLDSVGR